MRVSVAILRDVAAEKRAKEKAEAPTVKTEEETKAEAEKEAKAGAKPKEHKHTTNQLGKSVWRRTFRPLPEAKAVDLFADVLGDAFVLAVAGGLITYEYVKGKQKPDYNAEHIAELTEKLQEEERRIAELEESERGNRRSVQSLEQALEVMRNETAYVKVKRALLMA